jgi:alcohol dehydrogenase class IV
MEKIDTFSIKGFPNILFGNGYSDKIPDLIQLYGRNVLIITGARSFRESEHWTSLIKKLEDQKCIRYEASVRSEPSPEMINSITDEFRKYPIHVVVAIGGGSVIDSGKAVAAMLAEKDTVENFLEGIGTKKTSGVKVPFIAVPTTAGTGSEATKNTVLSVISGTGYKKSLRHDNYVPNYAVIDPVLSATCPREITAACGLDAISQLFESFTSNRANPVTDSLARSGLQYAVKGYDRLLNNLDDLSLRGMMAYAACISGITLSHAGLGVVHGIAGPIGGFFNIPHGVACGNILPHAVKMFAGKCRNNKNMTVIAKMVELGGLIEGKDISNDDSCIDAWISKCEEWVQISQIKKFRDYGIGHNDIKKIVDVSDYKNSPEKFTNKEMEEIVRLCI